MSELTREQMGPPDAVAGNLLSINGMLCDRVVALERELVEAQARITELEGDFLIVSEQRKAEKERLAEVEQELDKWRVDHHSQSEIMRSMDQQLAALTLTWTTELPPHVDDDVFYFWRLSRTQSPRVYRRSGPYWCVGTIVVQITGGEWAGPIPIPQERA